MRIPRIYIQAPLAQGLTLPLPLEQAHYLHRVLRMEAGRPLIVFNGQGGEYTATLSHINKNGGQLQLHQFTPHNKQSPLHSHLAIGLSKGERFEWVLQKAVELGISEITPLITERTEVRLQGDREDKKIQHWQKIIISSAEQCQRNQLPQLNPCIPLPQALPQLQADAKWVLHHRSQHSLTETQKPKSVCLLIGPEGGLTETEIQHACQTGFTPLTLGPRVLRTETAPLAALSILQFLWGDMG